MRCKYRPATLDGCDETRADTAVAHAGDQYIDRRLPLRLPHLLRNPLVCNHPRIMFRQRHEDENAATIARVRYPADDKLLKRGPVCSHAPYRTWHERQAQRRPGKNEGCHDEDYELQKKNCVAWSIA